jgi:penicillin-insensitive murein DD-endopeptidase
LALSSSPAWAESTCYGTVAKGRLESGVALPSRGPNFTSYSSMAEAVGRTYVHSTVRDILVDAYRELEKSAPGAHFVYGETGWKDGGRIRPHRTHQNGLSVDFMVPVRNRQGQAADLPISALNRFGYDLEFDRQGRFDDLTIDFRAVAEHLYQLDRAARARGVGIALVIFDPPFLNSLFEAPRGEYLKQHLKFNAE